MNNLKIQGISLKIVNNVIDHFLLDLKKTNPLLISMYKDRNKKPYLDLNPWSGEFVGKYITGSYFAYKLSKHEKLKERIVEVIDELISYQDKDGYLGTYSDNSKLTGANSFDPNNVGVTWDSWNHYHVLFGMVLWYEETKHERYLKTILKAADFYLNNFYNGKKKLSSIGSTEMNLSIYHFFAVLYNKTKDKRYLDFALQIEKDMQNANNAEDYLKIGLEHVDFYKCKKPRWESLHPMMGFIEMYKATNDKKYIDSIEFSINSIIKTDCHNTGGFSTKEQAIGNPYTFGAIETCCVVAFDALVKEYYKINPLVKYIDLLERAHYNAMRGAFNEFGSTSTYDTPMEGYKITNQVFNNFQTRAGAPNLNCCSVNAPRGISEIVDWMVYENKEYIHINSFEKCVYESDNAKFRISGKYPLKNKVSIDISYLDKPIKIRIPSWSNNTIISIDGKDINSISGDYLLVKNASIIDITFDYSLRFEEGKNDVLGKKCIYYGPLLLAYDRNKNEMDYENIKRIPKRYKTKIIDSSINITFSNGLVLSDFASAGESGNFYTTWFKIK